MANGEYSFTDADGVVMDDFQRMETSLDSGKMEYSYEDIAEEMESYLSHFKETLISLTGNPNIGDELSEYIKQVRTSDSSTNIKKIVQNFGESIDDVLIGSISCSTGGRGIFK